jgi:hypothetical protein
MVIVFERIRGTKQNHDTHKLGVQDTGNDEVVFKSHEQALPWE